MCLQQFEFSLSWDGFLLGILAVLSDVLNCKCSEKELPTSQSLGSTDFCSNAQS